MDEMIKDFVTEVTDLLHEMENDLILLEKDPGNTDIVNKIFRMMHTLKGSAAMCGFRNIQDITHAFEDVYEKIREGVIPVDTTIIDITLKGKDQIALMLDNRNDENETNRLINYLRSEFSNDIGHQFHNANTDSYFTGTDDHLYCILFTPDKEIFERGIDPDKVINELKNTGSVRIVPHEGKKSWNRQKADKVCLSKWEIYLSTLLSKEEVESIFLFYDESEFTVYSISNGNPGDNEQLHGSLHKLYKSNKDWSDHIGKMTTGLSSNENEDTLKKEVDRKLLIDTNPESSAGDNDSTINVSSRKLDELMNLVSELVTLTASLEVFSSEIRHPRLQNTIESVEKLTKRFRNNALDLRLVPVGTLLSRFKRQVRDLSKELDKNVNLIVEGQDIEIDKTILKAIENPLQHIIRNSLDHGIEKETERVAKGKTPAGLLKIAAFYSGANVLLQVQDDGNGINLERVKECAIEKGYITPDQTVTEQELINLTMEPGFTTALNTTIVSGRGVGMDVVKKELNRVGGSLEIFTEKNLGTSITMKLPTTLTIIDTLMVDVGSTRILIPLLDIEYCYQDKSSAIFNKDNRYVQYKNYPIPVVSLRQKFRYKDYENQEVMVIIINKFENRYAVVADHIIGEYQAVIKPLGELFINQPYFSGGSIMVDGKLSLILDTNFLFNQAIRNKI